MGKIPIRPLIFDGDVAYVPLTRGHQAIIDAADAHIVEQFNWIACVQKRGIYAIRSQWLEGGMIYVVRMHRAILSAPDGLEVDHINGNGLDNRRSNLRLATREENSRNIGISKANKSGFKGVALCRKTGRWTSRITFQDKEIWLGRHDTAEEASAAYIAKAKELHGEFWRGR